jgi:hypothetical protein
MSCRDLLGAGREYKSIRRKLEFQTGVRPRNHRICGRALTTNELTPAYTPHAIKRCPR